MTRGFARAVYDVGIRAGDVAPYQEEPSQPVSRVTAKHVVRATVEHFVKRVRAAIICATGQKRGVASLAEAAAALLTDKVGRIYRRNRLLGRQRTATTSLQVLFNLTILLEKIRVRGFHRGQGIYEAVALILFSAFRMILW